jgi:hypothetical protein
MAISLHLFSLSLLLHVPYLPLFSLFLSPRERFCGKKREGFADGKEREREMGAIAKANLAHTRWCGGGGGGGVCVFCLFSLSSLFSRRLRVPLSSFSQRSLS